MVVATPPALTIDEFLRLHGGELGVELVRGQVVRYPVPGAEHGRVCINAAFEVEQFLRKNRTGRAFANDTFVRVSDGTLRGADVCFWSYAKLPKEASVPDGVIEVAPDFVMEVKSPNDRWGQVFVKVGEYLGAGVSVVVIFDPGTETASVHRDQGEQQILSALEELTLPDVLPGFAVPVARFFEGE